MPDLDLTSPGQSRSTLVVTNERVYIMPYPSLLISLAVSAGFPSYGPLKYAWLRFNLSRWLQVQDNGAKWNFIYDFLSIINSNSVVILNRFGDIGHWKQLPLTWSDLERSKSRSRIFQKAVTSKRLQIGPITNNYGKNKSRRPLHVPLSLLPWPWPLALNNIGKWDSLLPRNKRL